MSPQPPPLRTRTFYTHDDICLMGVKGILPAAAIAALVRTARTRGAAVSYKMAAGRREEPYEITSSWWSAINGAGREEEIEFQVKRYVASRSLALVLPGVPGIYIQGVLGSPNDVVWLEPVNGP